MRTGIMGGTFNPVHNGHMFMAQEAIKHLGLDYVMLIPTGSPPHKSDETLLPAFERYEMCLLAASGYDDVVVSSMEIEREGTTYTIDTLNDLEARLGGQNKIYFIIGGDTVYQLETWKDYERVFKKCSFAVFAREGFNREEMPQKIDHLKNMYGADMELVSGTPPDISSSSIRNRISEGKPVSGLVPRLVEEYISRHKCYKYKS